MVIIFYTRNVNYLKLYSVLAENFYPAFITFYAYAPCIYIMGFYELLLVFFYAALVNTTHGLIGYGMFYMPNGPCVRILE
jgi:hypothetical protein